MRWRGAPEGDDGEAGRRVRRRARRGRLPSHVGGHVARVPLRPPRAVGGLPASACQRGRRAGVERGAGNPRDGGGGAASGAARGGGGPDLGGVSAARGGERGPYDRRGDRGNGGCVPAV